MTDMREKIARLEEVVAALVVAMVRELGTAHAGQLLDKLHSPAPPADMKEEGQ